MQRRAYGEQPVLAGCALATITGNVGIPGGHASGYAAQADDGGPLWNVFPKGKNPVKAKIPVFLWTEAILRGTEMSEKEGDAWISKVTSYHLSMSCNHCADPICMKSCPTEAIVKRDDGIVMIDPERCMGCRYCEWACPYGALQFDERKGQMTKCDLCFDYLDEGKQTSCVAACPMRVLDVGTMEELLEKYGKTKNIYPLPDPEICQPSFLIVPHKDATPESYDLTIENREEVQND